MHANHVLILAFNASTNFKLLLFQSNSSQDENEISMSKTPLQEQVPFIRLIYNFLSQSE